MTYFVDVERRAPSRRARETRARRVDAGRLIAVAALALASAATVALGAKNATSALAADAATDEGDAVAKLGYGYTTTYGWRAGLYNSRDACPPQEQCYRPFYDKDGTHRTRPRYRVYTYYTTNAWNWDCWCYPTVYHYYWTGYDYECPSEGECVDCEGYNSNYDNSYCTGHAVCGRGTITNTYIITRHPWGDGANQCSTWSQTKDCEVKCDAPTVTFGNSQRVISSNTFDFKVQVMHAKLCPNENCLTSLAATRDRITCEVRVKKVGHACSSYGAHLPCLNWDDFKGDLSLTTVDGSLVPGDYKITYDCHAVSKRGDYKYDTYGEEDVSARAKGAVTFEIVAGCNAVMPAGAGGSEGANSELVKLFLLGSDEFVQAPCAAIADTKENIFRRFDVSPTDGELSFDELAKAAKDRSTDAYILKLWNSMESVRLTLGQVVKSRVRPTHCPSVTDDADATFDAVVYPTSESGRETTTIECQASAMSASAQWSFDATKVPGRNQGENVCVYVDGVLFEAHEPSTAAPTDASRYTRYDTTGKYALTKIVDKRPVSGGIDDVQSFIAAQFTFDGVRHDGSTIPSNVKLSEDDASAQPTLKSHDGAMMQSSWFPICYGLHGGYCMYSKPGGYKYAGKALEHGGFAFSTWFRVANKNDFSNNDYVSENTIISLKSDIDAVLEARAQRNGVQDKSGSGSQATEEVDEHKLRMFGKTIGVVSNKKVQLVVEYTVKKSGGVKSTIATVNVEYTMRTWNDWYLVGFTYSNKGGLRVFSYPAGSDAKHTTQLKTWPKDKLAFTPNIVLFDTKQASTFEVDDVRLYTGDLNPSTFLSARSCGRYGYCANRAMATPVNRRVVCVFAHNKGVAGSYECAGMMYYDGSVIDLRPSMDMAGVIFAFRDTSWAETSFEIERKEYGNGGKFETVVLVEGDLKGCAAMFASITYIDREASVKPNSRWMYRVTTKSGSLNEETGLSYIVSPSYSFTTPWIGEVEGRVLAGESVAPVPHVRICAEFDKYIRHGRNADSFDETASAAIIYDHNLAKYKRATHSVKNLTSNAYVVTDGAVDESALSVAHGEHVRVDLGAWHSIGSIKVCVSAESSSLPAVVPYVSDADPDIPGVSDGHACVFSEHTNGCSSFRCVGASLKSLHGQHVTVRASSPTSITEIQVLGNHTRCAFSAVSDKDGEYHIDIKDSSGTMPSKAQLHVGAYKEEVFSITNVTLIESMKSARDQADVPVPRSEPKDVLLTLREQAAQKPLPNVTRTMNVEWTSMSRVASPAPNELKVTGYAGSWKQSATSVGTIVNAFDSTRGIMGASTTTYYSAIGLAYDRAQGSSNHPLVDVEFAAVRHGSDMVSIYENYNLKRTFTLSQSERRAGGVVKVVLNKNSTGVNYFVNDRLLWSTVPSAPMRFPLRARALFNSFGHFQKLGWVVDNAGPKYEYGEHVTFGSMTGATSPRAGEFEAMCGGPAFGSAFGSWREHHATSVDAIESAKDGRRGISGATTSNELVAFGLDYETTANATSTSRRRLLGGGEDERIAFESVEFLVKLSSSGLDIYENNVHRGNFTLEDDEKHAKGVVKIIVNDDNTRVDYFVNDRLLRSTVLSAPMQFPLRARAMSWLAYYNGGSCVGGRLTKLRWINDEALHLTRDADRDVSRDLTRHEFSTFVEKRLGFGDVGHVVVPDAPWSLIDTDGDGVLSAAEIFAVLNKFETRQLYVEPSLVYPSRDVKYAFGIQMHQSADDPSNNSTAGPGREVTSARACERVVFLRQAKVERPKSRQDWESIYDAIFGSEDASAAYDCVALSNATRDVIHVGDKESAAALPVVAFAPGTNKIMLDSESITRYAVAAERAEDVFNIVTRDGFRLRVTAQEQMPDIVHSFDKPPVRAPKKTDSTETDAGEKIFSDQVFTKATVLNAQHKRVEEKDFTDDTTAIVKGAVLFPKHLVEGSTECGVSGATIEVLESDGEPEEYETDAQGQFEIAVTRGKTFKFLAKLKGHTLCYAGTSVQDAVDRLSACSQTDSVDVTLTNAGDGNTLYFVDSTIRNIDLGLYEGECDARYAGATFKITPANGCHPSAYRTSAEIADWKFATNPETHPNAKSAEWPYAAMDYTVTLHAAPSNAGFLELKQAESWSDGCAGGDDDGDMLKYFRARDTLVRSVPMLAEHDFVQIRYKYHGYICVEVLDIPKIDDDEETCYDPREPKGGLTRRHFLGSSEYFGSSIPDVVDFRARAFEIHLGELNGEKRLNKCAKFPSEATKTGSTVLSFRQTVTDEANNPCHPNRGGDAECDFQPVAESEGDVGLISWPRLDGSLVQYKGVEKGQPNLAGNRRRFLEVTVTRSDDASIVKTSVTRNLIPLGSKPRDGGGEGDDTFWATVPIEGLVYTVVHDPPGGDSYAELAVGSTIGMEFDISGTRSASSNKDRERKQEKGTGVETDPGFSGGWIVEAGVNFPINWLEMKLALESEEKGPKIEMKSSNQTGWSLSAQTDRVIRSSQDAANPGRSGDAILGGGIELVYKLSDVLDVVDDLRTQNTPCLFISQAITWLPRKPTSYVFGVVSIETQILPNLKFLLTTTRSASNKDESGMYYPCGDDDAVATGNESISLCSNADVRAAWTNYLVRSIDTWRRTLAWSSPSVYMTQGGGGGKSKDYSQIERISAPMTDDERTPFGNNFAAGAEMFKAEFSRPMDDVMDELANTWDATFWMMPYNGLGPPPMAGDARVFSLFGGSQIAAIWDLDRRYWEPDQDDGGEGEATGREEFRDEWSWQITGEDPPDDGDARSDGVDYASGAAESLLAKTKSMMGGAKRKNYALNTATSIGKDFWQNKKHLDGLSTGKYEITHDGKFVKTSMYKNKKAAKKLKESVEDALADKSASAKAWRSVKRGGSSVAKTAREAAKKLAKAKNTVAGKMLIAGVVAGAAAAAYAASDSGYHYVSFPRQHYKQFTPTHADTFYDFDKSSTGNAAAYGSGMLAQSTFDLVENFQSCAGYECGEGEFENSAESMLSDVDGDGEISWLDTNALGEDMRISFSDGAASDRLVASFTGGQARAGMRLRGADPKEPTEETLLLTFTGGGHSMDYAYATSEKTSDNHYAIGMSLSGEWSNKYDLGLGGIIGLVVSVGMALGGLDTAAKSTFAKEIGIDRSFAWNKHGSLSTLYTLGDPELGDKFVVQVASDTRFGTPVFMTLGGRSLCPGEAQTVFREAGYTLELATTANERLNPGDRAVLHVLLHNDSPYREATTLGLQLIDGLTQSVSDVISAAYAVLDDLRATGQEVSDAVSAAASSSIAKDSDVVKKMVADALASANAGASAIDVAARVVESSKSAPNTGFEMDDAAFTIGGEKIIPNGDVFPFKFIGGDGLNVQKREAVTQFTLAVTPEVARARSMKYLVLRVLSLCEFTFWDNWRHAGTPIGHQIWMGEMSWSSNCPIASFNQATVDAYEFTTVLQSAQTLALSVYNPDRENLWPSSATPRESSNARLSKVYVQYRSKQGGEWITATDTTSSAKKNLLCDYSRDGGCEFGWSVKSLPEGDYDVRVKTFCTGSDVFASPDVRERVDEKMLQLRVDRTPPVEKGFSFDTMGERVLWVQFFEDIDCSNAKLSLRKTRTDSCESADDAVDTRASDFVISCRNAGSQGSWIMKYPSTLAGVYEGVLTGVTDIAGNEADTYTFSFGTTSAARECPKVIGAKRAALSTLGVADAPTDASFAAEERSTSFEPTSVALFATTFLAGALSACALFAIARRLSAVSTPQDAVRDERASIKSTSVLPSYGATV